MRHKQDAPQPLKDLCLLLVRPDKSAQAWYKELIAARDDGSLTTLKIEGLPGGVVYSTARYLWRYLNAAYPPEQVPACQEVTPEPLWIENLPRKLKDMCQELSTATKAGSAWLDEFRRAKRKGALVVRKREGRRMGTCYSTERDLFRYFNHTYLVERLPHGTY